MRKRARLALIGAYVQVEVVALLVGHCSKCVGFLDEAPGVPQLRAVADRSAGLMTPSLGRRT